jgi:hypothetical protein
VIAYGVSVQRLTLLTFSVLLAGWALAQAGVAKAPPKLKLGQSIVLTGGPPGEPPLRMRFTLLGYLDPARSPYYRPAKGTKFVAFRLRIANLSRRRWQGTLASWAELVDTRSRTYSVFTPVGRQWAILAPTLNDGTTIEARETVVGYLGWILPKTVKLKEFRYSFQLGPVTATWSLPRR